MDNEKLTDTENETEQAESEKKEAEQKEVEQSESEKKESEKKEAEQTESEKTEPEKIQTIEVTEEKKTEEKKTEESSNDKSNDKSEFFINEPFIDPSLYKHKRKKKIRKIVAASVLAFLLIVYFGGVLFFMHRFNSKTSINGKDVSFMKESEVEDMLRKDAERYELVIDFKDSSHTLKLGDGETEACLTEEVSAVLKKRTPFLWFADIFYDYEYEIPYTVTFDEEALTEWLNQFSEMDEALMDDPVDAKVIMENGEVVIVPESLGTRLDPSLVLAKVEYALSSYEDKVDLVSCDCYKRAEITSDCDFIVRTAENAEDYLKTSACYDFGHFRYEIPREELSVMAYVSDNGSIRISKNNVEGYVKRLSKQFSTVGTDRVFKTHSGKKIWVYGGEYGWQIDEEKEAEELYECMIARRDFVKEPACTRTGYTMNSTNDIGNSYVEVDLTNQRVYCYLKGHLQWASDCVSGHTPGHKTPGGLYSITYKKLHAILRGEDYETPVTYWMPFNRGIGLHDANWRWKFGEDIYMRDGSHGCVNLPPAKAAELFELVEPGMPVICYWIDESEEVME